MTLSRRQLLSTAGAALAAAAMPASLSAMQPIRRPGKPHLKLALAAYSVRNQLQGKAEPKMDMMGFVDYAATLGIDGVELTSYFFPETITPQYLNDLKRHCHISGLGISGGAIRNNFTMPPGDEVEKSHDHVEMWCRHYAALGAPVIRIFAGNPPKGISESQAIQYAIPNIKRACDVAAKHGVILGLENHDFLTKIDRMMELIDAIDHPYFGVNFDSGNFHSDTPYDDLAKIAPFTVNAQIKTETRNASGKRAPMDYPRVIQILRDGGYSGYIVLEYEGGEAPMEAIPKHLDALHKAIEKTA